MSTVTIPVATVEKLRKLKENRDEQDRVTQKLNKLNARLNVTPRERWEKYSDKLWYTMRECYVTLKSLAEEEERLCAVLIGELKPLQPPGSGSPLPPGKKKGHGTGELKKSKLKHQGAHGHIQKNSSKGHAQAWLPPEPVIGEMVAAKVSAPEAEKDDWIVVKVLGYDPYSSKYEVIDEEPGDEGDGPRKFELAGSFIIAFPSIDDPAAAPHFPPGGVVLAVYPGTTSLYRAVVSLSAPLRQSKEDDYFLEFDDDEEEGVIGLPQRRVQFHQVVPLPEGHRQ